jgi:hypothetical protein
MDILVDLAGVFLLVAIGAYVFFKRKMRAQGRDEIP